MKAFLYDVVTRNNVNQIKDQIKALKPNDEIDLHINSPGGEVSSGLALYSLLKSSPNKVTTNIDGMAGSIASVIALAGDEVNISPVGSIMIHNASAGVGGNADYLGKVVGELKKIDSTMASVYFDKSKLNADQVRALMDKEAVMNAQEAFEFGFVDNIVNPIKAVALIDPNKINNMDIDGVLKKASAFLGNNEEDKDVKALVDAADEKAKLEQEEKEANSEAADLMTAEMVKSVEYNAKITLFEEFVASTVEFIKAQPTKEELFAQIKEEVIADNKRLLATLKTKTQVTRSSTQPLAEQEEKNNEDVTPLYDAMAKIQEKTNKLYN